MPGGAAVKHATLWMAACLLAMCATGAHAVVTCFITSNGFATAYDPGAGATNITQTSFTVTCSRNAGTDPVTVNFATTVNNGGNPQGQNNRAAFGASYIRYDVYRDAACSTKWKGATSITGSVTMPLLNQQYSTTSTFWGCVLAGQAPPAGTYTDTMLMALAYNTPVQTAGGSFPVTITTPPVCAVSTAPGTVTMNYTSFGGVANGSTTFGVTCSLALPYTMALDATAGTVLGLNYTIGLSTGASVGTGAQQTHSINGSIAAGQSGTCATANCTSSQVRSVTVTY
jgi:spore coat protein U-like protein